MRFKRGTTGSETTRQRDISECTALQKFTHIVPQAVRFPFSRYKQRAFPEATHKRLTELGRPRARHTGDLSIASGSRRTQEPCHCDLVGKQAYLSFGQSYERIVAQTRTARIHYPAIHQSSDQRHGNRRRTRNRLPTDRHCVPIQRVNAGWGWER